MYNILVHGTRCTRTITTLPQISKKLLKDATWNNTFDHLSWRVDVKTMSRTSTEMNEPTAFFDLTCKRGHQFDNSENISSSNNKEQNARFEMSRTEVQEMLQSLNDVQKMIEEAS